MCGETGIPKTIGLSSMKESILLAGLMLEVAPVGLC
jgi:hypothetical protein